MNLKNQILNYERERSVYRIEDTHRRQTYLIEESTIKRLDSLQSYLELQNAKGSSLNNEDSQRQRKLAVGFKTKAVNVALENFIKTWEEENGHIPEIELIRYKANTNQNYRVYMFELDGEYHFVHHDNRGNELDHIIGNEKKIRNKFESYRDNEIKNGRPKQ